MSGSSELGYRVRGTASALYAADDMPLDDKITRYHLVNNLNHYSDIHGQVLVHWSCRSSIGPAKIPYAYSTATGWREVMRSGPFPLSLRPDGSSYRVRIAVGGRLSNVAASPGKIAVMMSTSVPRVGSPYVSLGTGSTAASYTDSIWISDDITNTTSAFRSGVSQGPQAYTRMIALTADEVTSFMTTTSTPVDIGGADSGVAQCIVQIMAFAKLNQPVGGTHEMRLEYLEATEFYG